MKVAATWGDPTTHAAIRHAAVTFRTQRPVWPGDSMRLQLDAAARCGGYTHDGAFFFCES